VMAGSALTLTGNFPAVDFAGTGGGTQAFLAVLLPILLPISILIVPFADLLLAVVRRTLKGQSPFAPDKRHLHHRLLEYGHSHRRAVLVMWLWAAFIALGGVGLSLYYTNRVVLVGLALWFAATVVLTLVVPRVDRPLQGLEEHPRPLEPVPPREPRPM
jgi:UDP-GlcNAc:undecaprenyl-phosphate GlcNAc-1-phosphate transferase